MNSISISRRDLALGASGLSLLGIAAPGQASAKPGGEGGKRVRIPADDRLDIIELMARYAWAYDTSNADALAATFTPDGVLEVTGKPMVTDRSGFPAFLAVAAGLRKGREGWQHLTDHHVFADYDGRHCTVYSYYLVPESDATGGDVTLRAMGYYVSHCVRTEEGWLFARREVHRWNGKSPF
ncbi:MAG: hypothetical protein B7Z20_05125 [Sphingobium sp. 32-64-5]|nr:MAG: hypothetical protein B7Z20_05125 [Sphingobium sp. 32-64-5]